VAVKFRPAREASGPWVTAFTRDIGVGGAFVETEKTEPVGRELEIEIEVPGAAGPISLGAEVRWLAGAGETPGHRSPGMGIKFAALDVETLLALSDLFASLAGGPAPAGEAQEP
jgi:Tfp pilus assembly protein PilZ